jgi:pyruvyltransferase
MIYLKQFSKFKNVGDVASSYITSRILAEPITVCGEAPIDKINLAAIGSIAHWADSNTIIWGAGLIANNIKLRSNPKRVLAVRGHLTRHQFDLMGIESSDLVGDPGALISDFYSPRVLKSQAVGVVPHYVDREEPFIEQCAERG